MNYLKHLTILSALALLLPGVSFARTNRQHSLDIRNPLQIGMTTLEPGTYKVQWQGAGPQVQVQFLEHGQTVATVPATLKMNDQQVLQDDIQTENAGNQQILMEIDFGHQKEALIFRKS